MARKMLIDEEFSKAGEDDREYDFDLFVIGAGSGGVRAARFSATNGAKVSKHELIHLNSLLMSRFLLVCHDSFELLDISMVISLLLTSICNVLIIARIYSLGS